MKNKRLLAVATAITMIAGSLTIPVTCPVKAEESTQEYVVLTKK